MKKKDNQYYLSFVAGILMGFLLSLKFGGIDLLELQVIATENKELTIKIDSIQQLKNEKEQQYNILISTIDSLSNSQLCTEFERVFGFNPYDLFGQNPQ